MEKFQVLISVIIRMEIQFWYLLSGLKTAGTRIEGQCFKFNEECKLVLADLVEIMNRSVFADNGIELKVCNLIERFIWTE